MRVRILCGRPFIWAHISVVEYLPCKQEVVGSIPINSTSLAVLAMLAFVRFSSLLLLLSQLKASRVYTMFCGRMAFLSKCSSVGRVLD